MKTKRRPNAFNVRMHAIAAERDEMIRELIFAAPLGISILDMAMKLAVSYKVVGRAVCRLRLQGLVVCLVRGQTRVWISRANMESAREVFDAEHRARKRRHELTRNERRRGVGRRDKAEAQAKPPKPAKVVQPKPQRDPLPGNEPRQIIVPAGQWEKPAAPRVNSVFALGAI